MGFLERSYPRPWLTAIMSLALLFLSSAAFGQMVFPFWEDKQDLQSAFHYQPAYFPEAPTMVAPIGNATYTMSNSDSPVFFMSEQYVETNTSVWTNADVTSLSDVIDIERQLEVERIFGSGVTGGTAYLSHRSLTMGMGASWRMDKKKKSQRRRTMRIGLTMDRQADLRYGQQLADFALDPVFEGPSPGGQMMDDGLLGDFALRHRAHASFLLGQTVELTPMRLFFGYNIEAIGGMKYVDARPGEKVGETTITSAGYEAVDGRLKEKERFINGYGASLDLGLSYRIDRKWTISASVMDIGAIQWDSLFQRTVTDAPETIFGIEPLSNLPVGYDGAAYGTEINSDSVVRLEGKDARLWLDRRLNIGLSNEFARLGLYANVSQAISDQEDVPDATNASFRASYLLNHEGKVRLNLSVGVNYGTDSGSSVHVGGRLDLEVIDVFIGSDGLLLSTAPHARNLLIVGVQFCPMGKRDVDRL